MPSFNCSSVLNFSCGTLREFCLTSALLELEPLSCICWSQLVPMVTAGSAQSPVLPTITSAVSFECCDEKNTWEIFFLPSSSSTSAVQTSLAENQHGVGNKAAAGVGGTGVWMRCPAHLQSRLSILSSSEVRNAVVMMARAGS